MCLQKTGFSPKPGACECDLTWKQSEDMISYNDLILINEGL